MGVGVRFRVWIGGFRGPVFLDFKGGSFGGVGSICGSRCRVCVCVCVCSPRAWLTSYLYSGLGSRLVV